MQGFIQTNESKIKPIGLIKIGRKKEITKNGKTIEIPESLDFFIATGQFQNYFTEAYPNKPNKIEITFGSNNFFDSFYERFELWSGSKRYSYGDGQDFKVYEEKTDEWLDKNMTDDKEFLSDLHKKIGSQWSVILSLTFLIPTIRGVWGFWRLNTKGNKSSIPAMKSAFMLAQEFAGTVIGVPFDLSVEKVVSHKPGSKSKFPVLQLTPNVSQGHLERIRQFIKDKNEFVGLLTESKIDSLTNQIEYKEIPEDIEDTINADYQLKLESQEE